MISCVSRCEMKHRSLVCMSFFLLCALYLQGLDFHSFSGGEWGDASTWWGTIVGPLPGPEDDVFITAGTEVLGGGDCHNLTIEYSGGIPGRLNGHHVGYDGCRVRGDLVCNGYLMPGSGGGTYTVELWGNLTVTNLLKPTSLHLTGTSLSVSDQVAISQSPGAIIFTSITVATPFPGIKLLTDLSLDSSDGYSISGTITGPEIYLNGHVISRCRLINCYFPASPSCISGSIANCQLSNVASWIELTNFGTSDLLNNQCVLNGTLINNGTFNGPISMSGAFECADILNYGILQNGWNGSLNITCHGDIVNNHTLISDLVFSPEVAHTWTEAMGSTTAGNYVNMSPSLTLLSDFTLQPGNTLHTGVLNLNGHTLHNASLLGGTLNGDSGALDNCWLSSVDVYGEIFLNGICQLLDSNTVFNGSTSVNGNLVGSTGDICSTIIHGLFYNNGVINPGWNGELNLTLGNGFSNHGSTTANLITFSGDETQYLNWSAGSVFAFDINNLCPELVLMGSSPINANNHTWSLGTCTLSGPQELGFINLANSIVGGDTHLGLDLATLTNMQFEVPVTVHGNGIHVTGTGVCFTADLTLMGQLAGENETDNSIHCEGDLIISGGALNDGYNGRMTAFLDSDLIINSGDVVLYNLVFSSNPLHELHCHNSGTAFSCIVDIQGGEILKLMTDLEVVANSLFRLNGGTLELNNHQLTLAILNGGTVLGGSLYACNLQQMQLTDIVINSTNILEDSNCVATGVLTVQGEFVSMNGEAAEFTVLGSISNVGIVSGGYLGTLTMLCYGSISNGGTWEADTFLRGNASRNLSLNCPSHFITVDDNSQFTLDAVNLLSSFTVNAGSAISVGTGAILMLANADDFYTANQSGYGSVVNHGSLSNLRTVSDTTPLDFHSLKLVPGAALAADYSAVDAAHIYGLSPDGISDIYLEYWFITPHGQSQLYNGSLCFHHSPDPYTRVWEEGLELWYRLLGQGIWQPYTGSFSYSLAEHTYTATDIPVGGEYVFVVGALARPENLQVEMVPTPGGDRPQLSWNSVPGASYYCVMGADTPDGPWALEGTTTQSFWLDNAPLNKRFYKVTARWGAR